jgi:predicted nucleotidyltransferase
VLVGCWLRTQNVCDPLAGTLYWWPSLPSATFWLVTPIEVIEEIGARLARAAPKDSRVVLFGSHAREQANDGSDYDVLVIEPEVADAAKEAVRLRAELGDLLVPIDVVVVDRARATRRATVRGTLVERALREGRVLAHT